MSVEDAAPAPEDDLEDDLFEAAEAEEEHGREALADADVDAVVDAGAGVVAVTATGPPLPLPFGFLGIEVGWRTCSVDQALAPASPASASLAVSGAPWVHLIY